MSECSFILASKGYSTCLDILFLSTLYILVIWSLPTWIRDTGQHGIDMRNATTPGNCITNYDRCCLLLSMLYILAILNSKCTIHEQLVFSELLVLFVLVLIVIFYLLQRFFFSRTFKKSYIYTFWQSYKIGSVCPCICNTSQELVHT